MNNMVIAHRRDTNQAKRAGDIAREWAAERHKLAAWTMPTMANRRDVWGGYHPLEEVGKEYMLSDGTKGKLGPQTTRPAPSRRGQEFLTEAVLARHFAGHRREDIAGLHSTSLENTSRWGGVDIDWHGPTSTAPEVNWRAALAWYNGLVRRGFQPLLTDSNGRGGFHLLVEFAAPLPTPRVYHFLKTLVADHAWHGMAKVPEIFPKQPQIAAGGFGNWLRLFGRHHTNRDHWSKVWDGSAWLAGAAAVAFILGLKGDPPTLVPESPTEPPRRNTAVRNPADAGDNLARRVAAYLAKLPTGLGEGAGRDDIAYHFACFLARDLALGDEIALAWLERWDKYNAVPKGTAALAEILANARKYGRAEIGSGLGRDVPRRGGRHRPRTLHAELEVPE
jgi:hypothetical protein